MTEQIKIQNFSADEIKAQIHTILRVLRPLSKFTRTKLDDNAVLVLEAIEASDELLALVEQFFGGNEEPDVTGTSDDTKIEWPRIKDFLPQFGQILEETQQ